MPLLLHRVYLDVSALCRPFDDQGQLRVRLETDAVPLILRQLEAKTYTLIASPMHDVEIAAIDDFAEREHLQRILDKSGAGFGFNLAKARERAEDLVRQVIGIADAAHLSFAEQAGCDFITCDDRLIRQCKRSIPAIWVGTPIAYCEKEDLK